MLGAWRAMSDTVYQYREMLVSETSAACSWLPGWTYSGVQLACIAACGGIDATYRRWLDTFRSKTAG